MPVRKVNREDIVQHAFRMFKLQGYHRTSLRDIAAACGLLKGSIYHYFDSKEDLMKEVLTSGHGKVKSEVLSVAYHDSVSPKKRMAAIFDLIQNTYLKDEGGCIMGNIGLETSYTMPQFRNIIQGFFEDWIAAFAHIYKSKMTARAARQQAERDVMELEGAIMLCRIFNDQRYITGTINRIMKKM